MSRILVVDDEPAIGWSLRELLADEGHAVDVAANVADALAAATRSRPDAILLDVRLPGRDGIDAIPDLRETGPAPIVVMTAFGDLDTAVRAVRAGAFDYLVKPFDLEHVSAVVARALSQWLPREPAGEPEATPPPLVGSSAAMQEVYKRIAAAAADERPLLITGLAGSGKDLAARAVHAHGPRPGGPFVATSLAALAPTAIGGELFGSSDAAGLLELASGGTLLIEAIEVAPPEVQARLANVIATRELFRGGTAHPLDARLIVASRLGPETLALDQRLAALVSPAPIAMPALADRCDDIEPLVRSFLARHAAATQAATVPAVSPEFLAVVLGRDWPENVRDLRAAVEHAAVIARGAALRPEHLPPREVTATGAGPLETAGHHVDAAIKDWAAAARAAFGRLPEPDLHNRAIRLVEATLLREALAHAGGNRTAAAKLLGLDRATLRTKLRQFGLDD
jgi:two-component system nitrogen regulation response regulator GlnG